MTMTEKKFDEELAIKEFLKAKNDEHHAATVEEMKTNLAKKGIIPGALVIDADRKHGIGEVIKIEVMTKPHSKRPQDEQLYVQIERRPKGRVRIARVRYDNALTLHVLQPPA